MRILISGSSGLVGKALIAFFKERQDEIIKLVHQPSTKDDEISWDIEKKHLSSPLEDFDVVIHLAGESIMGRWNKNKKKAIYESRINGTAFLCERLSQLVNPPKVFICASAIGYYGDRGEEILTEQSAKGSGFLADVCQDWENTTHLLNDRDIRTLNLRFGAILSQKGGALKQMLFPFQLGLGAQLGNGNQWFSWIALDEVVNVIAFVLQNENLKGPINVVSPNPVTNKTFTQILANVLNRSTFIHLPKWIVKLIVGEMADDLLLASIRVKPEKLEQNRYPFLYPFLEQALKHEIR